MKLTRWLVGCCLLWSTGVLAQTPAPGPDLITGTWTGDIGLNETQRHAVTFVLKYDGKGAITGTVSGPGPGQLRSGSYDPQTGSVKLAVSVDDGAVFSFDGIAVNGTATGRVNGNNQTGTFRLLRGDGTQASASAGAANTELRRSFSEVSGWITKAADLVPADKYSYRPVQTVRTYGELLGHIADSYLYYCARAAGRNVQWSDAIEKGRTDRATIVQKLKESVDTCNAAYAGDSQPGALVDNVGHTNLHYGNIITYIRMLGLVPPSS